MVLLVPVAAAMTVVAGSVGAGLGTVAAWTGLSTHDTAAHTFG